MKYTYRSFTYRIISKTFFPIYYEEVDDIIYIVKMIDVENICFNNFELGELSVKIVEAAILNPNIKSFSIVDSSISLNAYKKIIDLFSQSKIDRIELFNDYYSINKINNAEIILKMLIEMMKTNIFLTRLDIYYNETITSESNRMLISEFWKLLKRNNVNMKNREITLLGLLI
jgi:hypothetical protein